MLLSLRLLRKAKCKIVSFPPVEGLLGYTKRALASTGYVGNIFQTPLDLPSRSYTVEYVDAVICPRCKRETHPDAVNEACRGNHYDV